MGQALRTPVFADSEVATAGLSKSAKILTHPKLTVASVRDAYREACIESMRAAFPAPSRHASCKRAEDETGVHWSNFERIFSGLTATPDPSLMLIVARVYQDRTGKQSPLWLMIARMMGGGA